MGQLPVGAVGNASGVFMNRSQIGLLLVGHGSHLSAESATPIHDLVRRLEGMGSFGEVRAAFWKEEPELRYALDLMQSREVFVIPIFTSAGYFTERVVPRELRLDGPLTLRGGRRIHYAPPVGVHSGMARIVLERAHEAAPTTAEEKTNSTLVIIGHGTELHPGSSGTTQAIVERLQGEEYKSVRPAFLDQDPKLDTVLAEVDGRVVVVPFFISEGWHAGTTIPRDLEGFELHYARAVGTHPAMAEVVGEMVAELTDPAALGHVGSGGLVAETGPPPVVMAREAFMTSCLASGFRPLQLLQVELRRDEGSKGAFELRHVEDWNRPAEGLRVLTDPADGTAAGARADAGAHRPLRSAPSLAHGWRFTAEHPAQVWGFMDRLYPGALLHRYLHKRGELPIVTFQEIAARQSGIHARVGELTGELVDDLVRRVCAPTGCLRVPIWHDSSNPGGQGRLEPEERDLPCPEPCSILISEAGKAITSTG